MGKKRRVNARPNKFGAKHGHLLRGKNRPSNNTTATVSNSVVDAKVAEAATVSDITPATIIEEETANEAATVEEEAPQTTIATPTTTSTTTRATTRSKTRAKKAKVKTKRVD